MSILDRFNKKVSNKIVDTPVHIGKVSGVDVSASTVSPREARVTNLLMRLRQTGEATEAIKLLIKEHPDTSMAYTILMSLVNQGGNIKFIPNNNNDNKKAKQYEDEWRQFAARINKQSATGLDGLIQQLHSSDFIEGGMACEVVVENGLKDIEDVYVISPTTLEFKLESRNGKTDYVPYQRVGSKTADLSKANFIWQPYNPDIGKPTGNLLFKPVIQAADMQLEFFKSSQTVLYRVGTPRYKFSVNVEKLAANAPPEVRNNAAKLTEYIKSRVNEIANGLRGIGVENDFVLTDDTKADVIGGDSPAFFQGIGAYAEIIDTQIMNALKVLGSLMNRHQSGGSYALSTVEFKIITDMLKPRQDAVKRIVEKIARIWLRVHGYAADVKYTPNPIEWQTFKDKVEYQIKKLEVNRRAEEYGYISPDEAAREATGAAGAHKATENLFEYIKNANTINEKKTE